MERYYYIDDTTSLHSWLIKVKNIIKIIFGESSIQFNELLKLTQIATYHSHEVNAIGGLLLGSLDDLESGFLIGHEFLLAGELFDYILEEAKYLNSNGYKDPAAVLARVVLEDSLRRIAKREGLNDKDKSSKMNDDLKSKGIYPQPQWRLCQAWLDIGNAAAHGEFADYTKEDVLKMIEGIGQFMAKHFS